MNFDQLFGLHEEVENRLQEAQKNKEFKDVGKRVSGSAKEKRAMSALIRSADLSNLEKDEATAIETIVKDRVWPKIIAEQEIDLGVTSGCAFLKHSLRSAFGAKPKENTHSSRRAYIGIAERIQKLFSDCYTVADIKQMADEIGRWRVSDSTFLFDESVLETMTAEELTKKFASYTIRFKFQEAVSTEFYNLLFRSSKAGANAWLKALEYDGVTAEQEAAFRERHQTNLTEKISQYQQKLIEHSTADSNKLRELKKGWTGMPNELEAFRQRAIAYCANKVKEFEKALEEFPQQLKQRPPDWSWAEGKKSGQRQRPELIVNQPPPLSFIKRTGGLEITQVSQQEIIDQFGFKYVEFGNSITDKEAREHVRHFLGALVDLFEILNIHQKQVNEMGDLSIAFASRGRKGSAAVYYRLHKIININRSNGDGSVAHEWMHYLDHLFWQKFKRFDQGDQFKLASEKLDLLTDTDATRAFKNLCNALRRGSGTTKTVKNYFEANASHNYRNAMKADLESTLDHLKYRYSYLFNDSQQNSFRDAMRVFGYVAHHFEQKGIVVEREISRSSLFYYHSAQMSSQYWIKPQELLARAFETFMFDKLKHLDRFNNYLVNDEWYDHPSGVYPSGDERDLFLLRFEEFFAALKRDLSLQPFQPFTARRTEEYIVLDAQSESEEKVESGVVVTTTLSELLRLEVSLYKVAS